MLAVRIFRHAVRQVTGNLGAALRLSTLPMVLQYATILALGRGLFYDPAPDGAPPAGAIGALAAIILVSAFAGTWMAVAWHRFVLLDERPGGFLPSLHSERMLAHFGRSLLLALLLAGVELGGALPLALVAGLVGSLVPPLQVVVIVLGGLALLAAVAIAFFRLSPMLPAAALGRDASLAAAWRATAGRDGAFLLLALINLAAVLVATLPDLAFGALGLGVFGFAWQMASGWALALLLLSTLTTIYGHCVQGRALM